jgi:hypothetical protein
VSASDWILCNEGRLCPLCRSPWGCAVRKDGLLIRCHGQQAGHIHKDYDRHGVRAYFHPALGGQPVPEGWQPLWEALHRAGPAALFDDPELLRDLARRTCDRPDRLAALRARLKGAVSLDDLRQALEPHYGALRGRLCRRANGAARRARRPVTGRLPCCGGCWRTGPGRPRIAMRRPGRRGSPGPRCAGPRRRWASRACRATAATGRSSGACGPCQPGRHKPRREPLTGRG